MSSLEGNWFIPRLAQPSYLYGDLDFANTPAVYLLAGNLPSE